MKDKFLKYQAQTSEHPLLLKVSRAEGSYVYDENNKPYLDFIAGVSAVTLGHSHPKIINAITEQAQRYMHVMVYGEFIQEPSVQLCELLAEHLPNPLETTYLVNSGTEAIEGAMKLAKRHTGCTQIIAAKNAYHGNTQGSMSILGNEEVKQAFRPLIPDVDFITYNDVADIQKITNKTAAVVLETIQGGAGFILPDASYLSKIRDRCNQTGTLLILDEVQSGFGRTGKLFAFEHYHLIPDILVMGKGMASGMPIGAFTSSQKIMSSLSHHPKLGHITTFGGHPVIAAAALATLQELTQTQIISQVIDKETLFRQHLQHPLIREIRGRGLMLALMMPSSEIATRLILDALEDGLILFWLLYEPCAVRISPPLTISEQEIKLGCAQIIQLLDKIEDKN